MNEIKIIKNYNIINPLAINPAINATTNIEPNIIYLALVIDVDVDVPDVLGDGLILQF